MTDFPTRAEMELVYYEQVLRHCGYNVTLAARVSGVARATFFRKVKAFRLRPLDARRKKALELARVMFEEAWQEKRGMLRVV